MGRKQLNHVQYKRNIHPDFVSKMDKELNRLKNEFSQKQLKTKTYKSWNLQTKKEKED